MSVENLATSELIILREKNQALEVRLAQYEKYIEILESAIKDSRRKLYAPSSEKIDEQLNLFNEAEKEESDETPELPIGGLDDDTVIIPEHKRRKRGRKPLPAELPREEVIIDLKEEEKFCPVHGEPLKEIGRDISEKLEIIPMKIWVKRTIVIKYADTCCDHSKIKTAPLPNEMIPRSITTPGLLAHVATSKFCDGLPFYRLENIFERSGIDISRGAMAHWMMRVGEKLLPLYMLLELYLLSSKYIQCDETTVQVLNEEGKKATSTSYIQMRINSGT